MDLQLTTLILVSASLALSVLLLAFYTKLNARLKRMIVICRALSNLEKKAVEGKVRKRYVVFKIIAEDKFSKGDVGESIKKFIVNSVGEVGFIKFNPELIYFDDETQAGVLRVAHRYSKLLVGLIGLMKEIDGKKCLIVPIKTTGTLKKARRILYTLSERKIY